MVAKPRGDMQQKLKVNRFWLYSTTVVQDTFNVRVFGSNPNEATNIQPEGWLNLPRVLKIISRCACCGAQT